MKYTKIQIYDLDPVSKIWSHTYTCISIVVEAEQTTVRRYVGG